MQIETQKDKLKDGTTIVYSTPFKEDANELCDLFNEIITLDDYNASSNHDHKFLKENIEKQIEKHQLSSNMLYVVGKIDNQIVAEANLRPVANMYRLRHRLEMGIGVKKEYRNKGIASSLLKIVIEKAKNEGFEQINLEVATQNKYAIKLYKKFGFKKTGLKQNALKIDDSSYMDCVDMTKML